jgi:hypothetical protein
MGDPAFQESSDDGTPHAGDVLPLAFLLRDETLVSFSS